MRRTLEIIKMHTYARSDNPRAHILMHKPPQYLAALKEYAA